MPLLSSLTTGELIHHAENQPQLSPLELELLDRLIRCLDEVDTLCKCFHKPSSDLRERRGARG